MRTSLIDRALVDNPERQILAVDVRVGFEEQLLEIFERKACEELSHASDHLQHDAGSVVLWNP